VVRIDDAGWTLNVGEGGFENSPIAVNDGHTPFFFHREVGRLDSKRSREKTIGRRRCSRTLEVSENDVPRFPPGIFFDPPCESLSDASVADGMNRSRSFRINRLLTCRFRRFRNDDD
jgi:hypothetical protein